MKALVCNSGDDWVGPALITLLVLVMPTSGGLENMLENNHYITPTAYHPAHRRMGDSCSGRIGRIKVMLWNDPPAAAVASQTLINNLDLEVITPSSSTVLPFILDTTAANVKNNAVTGVDNINNIEQVVTKNPTAGNYTFRVKTNQYCCQPITGIFCSVWLLCRFETNWWHPLVAKPIYMAENMVIQWDSYGTPENPFTVEYSLTMALTGRWSAITFLQTGVIILYHTWS